MIGIKFVAGRVDVSNATPTQVLATGRPTQGIQLKAPTSNSNTVFIGKNNVTLIANCYPMHPGDSVFLPIDNTEELYALGAASGDKLHYIII